jgi:hypothetical protein
MRTALIIAAGLCLLSSTAIVLSQSTDVFDFIPPGGRTILSDLLVDGLPDAVQEELNGGARDSMAWLDYLEQTAAEVPVVANLDEFERQTLADYLHYNAPLGDVVPIDQASLPMDGRDMTLRYCQSCHIVTVVVTQSRAREAWLGTLHKPSHIEVDLTEQEREALSDYLVVNAGIPIEDVPPELRAGGASY